MVIESVVMASAILKQVSETIGAVNEGKASIETAMGLIADFGHGLNEFQKSKSGGVTGFTKLSNGNNLYLKGKLEYYNTLSKIWELPLE